LELIEQAKEAIRRGYNLSEVAARAKPAKLSAVARGIVIALKGQERIAKLLGLDVIKVDLGLDEVAADAIRDRLFSDLVGNGGESPIRTLYDESAQESGQAGSGNSASPQRAPSQDSPTETGGAGAR
jgi:hypothetical protein